MCEESVCFWLDSVVGNPAPYGFPVPSFLLLLESLLLHTFYQSACIYLFLLYVCSLPTPVQYHPLEMLRDASNTNIIMTEAM